MATKRIKFGSNFAPKATVGAKADTTKTIGFSGLSEEEKENLKTKLSSDEEIKEDVVDITSVIPDENYVIKKISRAKLKPAPDEWNFFSKPSKDKLIELAESVYHNGLLQPIVVREMDPEGRTCQILAGHTRNAVYDLLYEILEDPKYLEIESIIYPYNTVDDEQAQDIICDTNFMQRGNLPSREMAKCIYLKAKRLKEDSSRGDGGIAQKIADKYNIKKTSVFMWKKLANLIDELQDIIDARRITLKNAYKLAFLSKEDQQKLLDTCSNYLSNESLKLVKPNDDLDTIIQKIENNFGVANKSFRYDILETQLRSIKDEPILVFASPDKKVAIIEAINKIDGAYIINS